ncbi:MAG: branched-chain amino acid aminotransferase [Bacteroidia bacterium]|jgi:branched-chain amino acid aminotransferase
MDNSTAISIKISKTPQSRIEQCDFENIQFGSIFADHMFRVDYKDGEWGEPEISPFTEIRMSPSLSALHYGQSIFEGMKAFKSGDGEPQLFRPTDNWRRFNLSAKRMAMPEIPEELFIEGLKELIRIDADWIPTKTGSALYVRPFMFATDDFLGVRPSQQFSFMIFTCPVNSYYPKPINVLVEQKYARAFNGGVGFAKAAGNYGASMLPTLEAQQQGFEQIIWTDAVQHEFVEESGTTNLFFVIDDKVLTPKPDGTILEGITRDSCITILRSKGFVIEERPVSIKEIVQAHEQGKLQDAFGTGTAALIAKIASFTYQDKRYELPPTETRKVSNLLYNTLEDIRTSRIPDTFNWIVKVDA